MLFLEIMDEIPNLTKLQNSPKTTLLSVADNNATLKQAPATAHSIRFLNHTLEGAYFNFTRTFQKRPIGISTEYSNKL